MERTAPLIKKDVRISFCSIFSIVFSIGARPFLYDFGTPLPYLVFNNRDACVISGRLCVISLGENMRLEVVRTETVIITWTVMQNMHALFMMLSEW